MRYIILLSSRLIFLIWGEEGGGGVMILLPILRFEEDSTGFQTFVIVAVWRTSCERICRKQIGGRSSNDKWNRSHTKVAHTVNSFAPKNVKASLKARAKCDWAKIEDGFFGNENDVMRCKCWMPASQQATSPQHIYFICRFSSLLDKKGLDLILLGGVGKSITVRSKSTQLVL